MKTEIVDKLLNAINEINASRTSSYDTEAEVVRVDGRTAWVHIPGGIDETPVSLTIDAKVGDIVQTRISGGRAFLVGNGSSPPTDDTTAIYARNIADTAQTTAESAQEAAEAVEGIATAAGANAAQAIHLAEGINEHFWHDSTGAHITEDTQEDYRADPANAGGNTLITSQGMAIRKGQTELASFTANNGVQIGLDNSQHLNMDSDSLDVYDNTGAVVATIAEKSTFGRHQWSRANFQSGHFNIGEIYNNNKQYTESFTGDGTTSVFWLSYASASTNSEDATCSINNVRYNNFEIRFTAPLGSSIILAEAPPSGATVKVTYYSADSYSTIGSVAQEGTIQRGIRSVGIGMVGSVGGDYAVAMNRLTVADRKSQTAIGEYNIREFGSSDSRGTYVFIIGNGTSNDARSNAFTVDWSGNVEAAGDIKATGDLYASNTKIADFVIDQGASGNWTYRHWNSGKKEAWLSGSVSTGSTWTASGNVYRASWSTTIPAAVGFSSAPHTIIVNGASAQNVFTINGGASSSTAISGYAFRGSSYSSSSSVTLSIYAWTD